MCGACCRKKGITFFEEEAKQIVKLGYRDWIRLNFDKYRHTYLMPEIESYFKTWVLDREVCPFLKEDNKCSIYSRRFYSCKAFPFNEIRIFYFSRFMWISFNDRCKHFNEPDQELIDLEKAMELAQHGINFVAKIYGFSQRIRIHPEIMDAVRIHDTVLPKDKERFESLLEQYGVNKEEFSEFSKFAYASPQPFP